MRRDERIASILDAAARVLAARGTFGLTMRAVAREARVSVANLYSYVGSREELIYRVHLAVLDVAVASAQATAGAAKARERLRALLTDHVRRVASRPIEADILRAATPALRGERARRVDEQRRRYAAFVRAAIDSVLGALPSARSDERARMVLGMADRLALDAPTRGATTPEPLAAAVLRLLAAAPPRTKRR